MTWILNTIVSASLRRVSLGISANLRITVSGLAKLPILKTKLRIKTLYGNFAKPLLAAGLSHKQQ